MKRIDRIVVGVLGGLVAALVFALAAARYRTFHNATFDLAFYVRIAWGLAHGDAYEPIVGASVLGLHLSLVLVPLGLLGRLIGNTPYVLLAAQALSVAATAWPLARYGARRLGSAGAWLGAAAILLYPNVIHVATYEFHPGTLAVLPLAWAIDAADRRDAKGFAWAAAFVLACREDLGMTAVVLAACVFVEAKSMRRPALAVALGSAGWVLLFALVLHPLFRPATGSMEAHFGKWGQSLGQAFLTWITRPDLVAQHLATPTRATYVLRILLPLGLLPLARPWWLLPTIPIVALNLLSDFPTTTRIDSHYLTPAVPFLVASALDGLHRIAALRPVQGRARSLAPILLAAPLGVTHVAWGGAPWSRDFDRRSFTADARTAMAEQVLSRIAPHVPVQAPDELLAHVAERPRVYRSPPPDRGAHDIVLATWHRERWHGDETLLRTTEEPVVRSWLARTAFGSVFANREYLLVRRNVGRREGLAKALLTPLRSVPVNAHRLAECLSVTKARRVNTTTIELTFVSPEGCPPDLAIRIGNEPKPTRVELLLDGHVSPNRFGGTTFRSRHTVPGLRPTDSTVHIGALRSSGAPPTPNDPVSVAVPLD